MVTLAQLPAAGNPPAVNLRVVDKNLTFTRETWDTGKDD
jgi:hypothetical protein